MSTKVQLTIDLEYDLPPSKYNKIEIEKILAIMCHELRRDKSFTWQDIEVKNYNYRINLNPYYSRNKKNYNKKTGENKWIHLQESET